VCRNECLFGLGNFLKCNHNILEWHIRVKEALHLCSANAHRYTVFWMFLAFGSHSDSSMLNQATGNMGLLYRFG
jgi:hypothetical protein